MSNPDFDIASSDLGKGVLQIVSTVSNFSTTVGMGYWGGYMFGSVHIWGAGYLNYYSTEGTMIGEKDFSLNIIGN